MLGLRSRLLSMLRLPGRLRCGLLSVLRCGLGLGGLVLLRLRLALLLLGGMRG
jgi:hypothetical protein